MGSKTSSQQQQQQQQTTTANPAAVAAYNQALGMASSAAATPYQAYTGELTAPVNAQEQTATSALNGLGAASNGYFSSAAQQSGLGAAAVNPTALNASAINQYMSPYQNSVINATEAQIANTDAQQAQQQTSNAIGAGAFGGDRAGAAQAALAGQQAIANNSTIAGLENQNYSQALTTAEGQQSLGLGAAQANRAAVQQNASTLAGLGAASATAGTGIADAQLGAGALAQQTSQAADTANYGQFEQQLAYPYQQAQFYSNIAEGIAPNYGSSTSGTSTSTTQTSPLNSILGLGLGTASLLSDERAKDNIEPVGRMFDGQTLYRYNYKDEPHVTRVGLIAQDVEKKHPHAVRTLGDAKVVDYAEATRRAADKGHFARGGNAGLGLARAVGGSVGTMPYTDAGSSYVPNVGATPVARMLQGGLNFSSQGQQQQTNPLLTQGLGMATKAAGGSGQSAWLSSPLGSAVSNGLGSAFVGTNSFGMPSFAEGGKVVSLGLSRARRGYDGGGVVGDGSLVFDPTAVANGTIGSVPAQDPSVSASGLPTFAQGLGAASMPPSNDNASAPATTVTPPSTYVPAPAPNAQAYTGGDGNGLGAAGITDPSAMNAPAAPGLGSAVSAINAAAPPSTDPMGGYAARVRGIESRGDDTAVSPSGATGRYQFEPSTWADVARKHPDLGLTPGGITDPGQQDAAMQAFTADNKAELTKALGRPPTPDELYLAHQQGAGGAVKLLTNPTVRAGDLVGNSAIASNGGDPNAPAGSFTGMWSSRFNGGGGLGSAMSYSGGSGDMASGLGEAAQSGARAAAGSLGLANLSDLFGGVVGGTGKPSAGHSGGLIGLLPGISDDARLGLAAAGFGMAQSKSMSPGVAAGEGGLAGIKTYQDQRELGIKQQTAQVTAQKFALELEQFRRQMKAQDAAAQIAAGGAQAAGVPSGPTNVASSPVSPDGRMSGASAPTASVPATTPTSSFDWSKVAPDSNPAGLDALANRYEAAANAGVANPETASMYGRMAAQARSQASAIRQSGKLTLRDGSTVLAPGFTDTEGAIEGAKTDAREKAQAGYRVREVQPEPGGPTTYTTDAAVLGHGGAPVGAGSPPGSAAGAPPSSVAKQPAFYAAKQDMIAKNESEMVEKFQARQVARQRLQDLQGILQNYRTGAFAEQKADLAAKLSAIGLPVSSKNMQNAAEFQKFTKDATANLFDNVKQMGGRVLVSEIEGLKGANANAELQPAANAAIIGQGIGLLNYEDKHTQDYFDWKKTNPNASDTSPFELAWAKNNPVAPFVDAARKNTAARGVDVPPPDKRTVGQAYMTPKGKLVWAGNGWRASQ